MMSLCRDIIKTYKSSHKDFDYYLAIIEKIETNYVNNPDISIESAKALIEGISKTILLRLEVKYTLAIVNKMDFPDLFKNACWSIKRHISIEDDFLHRTSAMIHCLAEIRNNRGDISHGKAVPKLEVSSVESSIMVMQITDALVNYILKAFFKIDLGHKEAVAYSDNPAFNDELDEIYSPPSIKYSRALFDQDIVAYEEQLKEHLERIKDGKE
jgi:hypothetical protein